MSKYEKISSVVPTNIKNILVAGEKIIWSGKPKKSAFVIYKIFTMLPIAIIWGAFDGFIISMMFEEIEDFPLFGIVGLLAFFALHLMPVWIWLSNVLTANKKWKNTEYMITDKRIILASGFIGMNYQSIYYKDIENIDLRINAIDKLLKVGDIYFSTVKDEKVAFLDIEDSYEVYSKMQKTVLDIQTDIEFPNNYRPKTNDGYNTKYNNKF